MADQTQFTHIFALDIVPILDYAPVSQHVVQDLQAGMALRRLVDLKDVLCATKDRIKIPQNFSVWTIEKNWVS